MAIRKITPSDRLEYLKMSEEFYHSDAVIAPIPMSYVENTFNELMRSDTYLFCYIIEHNGTTAGFALFSRSYSPEAGGMVLWLEELYLKPEFRHQGFGTQVLTFIMQELAPHYSRVRLEVEDYNTIAIELYKKFGLDFLPYSQMVRDF
jgi:ribosomal protein S18 acetylase RimI-like enzyme